MNAQRPTFNGGIRRRQGYGGRVKGQPTGPIYVSAKRTQIIFAHFSMYHFYLQKLMPFATAFANGFVLEKRTQNRGLFVGSAAAFGFVFGKRSHRGSRDGNVRPTFKPRKEFGAGGTGGRNGFNVHHWCGSRSQCCASLRLRQARFSACILAESVAVLLAYGDFSRPHPVVGEAVAGDVTPNGNYLVAGWLNGYTYE